MDYFGIQVDGLRLARLGRKAASQARHSVAAGLTGNYPAASMEGECGLEGELSTGEGLSPIVDGRPAQEGLTIQQRWSFFLVTASALLIVVLFWRTGLSIVQTWNSSRTFSHGFLIVPLFLYLIWVRRAQVSSLPSKPNFWGLPLLAVLGAGWLLGNLGEVQIAQQFALVGMLVAAIWTVLGTDLVRALLFPLAFLFFAVPFGENLVGRLQDVTAWFAVTGLRLTNIPVILENRTITVPSGVWVVAEACSGIRYLISSLVLGLVFSSIVYRSWRRRLAFVIASIVVPIIANGLRAYGVIVLGYLTSNELASGVAHIIYGMVFFTVVQLVLFAIGLKWRESPACPTRHLASPELDGHARSAQAAALAAVCAIALVGWLPWSASHLWNRPFASDIRRQPPLSVSLPWQPAATYDISWAPDLHPDAKPPKVTLPELVGTSICSARYSDHRGLELVSGYNRVVNPDIWFDEPGRLKNVIVDGQTVTVQQRLLRSNFGSRVDWIWYWVGGEFTANPGRVKFLRAKARLFGRPATAAVIALSADYREDSSDAEKDLQDFLLHISVSTVLREPPKSSLIWNDQLGFFCFAFPCTKQRRWQSRRLSRWLIISKSACVNRGSGRWYGLYPVISPPSVGHENYPEACRIHSASQKLRSTSRSYPARRTSLQNRLLVCRLPPQDVKGGLGQVGVPQLQIL